MYTDIVDFELAKILDNRIFPDNLNKYAAEDLECTMDNYLGSRKYKEGELIDYSEDYIHGKYYYAPTYAEIIDWLFREYDIVIELIPNSVFAFKKIVAYCYNVYQINTKTNKLDKLFSRSIEKVSFELAIKEITEAIINKEYTIYDGWLDWRITSNDEYYINTGEDE